MPIRPFLSIPKDLREWTKFFKETSVTAASSTEADHAITADTATNATNLNGQAASYYLNASNIDTGTLDDARIPSGIARDAEVTAAVTAHESLADPHSVYPLAAGTETITGAWGFSLPPKTPAYAVASLPSAATYQYGRAIATDANATTFASVVAGGGANVVPVYSDGTNWRIG